MRLWSEERKSGSIELLMTLPVILESWLGKFIAAWLFAGLALLLTFPMVLTVNFLGSPDNGAYTGYLGSFLLAGAFLAVSACMSVLSKSPSGFYSAWLCVLFFCFRPCTGAGCFSRMGTAWWLDLLASMSFLTVSVGESRVWMPVIYCFLSALSLPG